MALISLLAGLAALAAGIHLLYLSPAETGHSPALDWEPANARVEIGTGTLTAEGLLVQFNEEGRAIITLPIPPLSSENYLFLRLAFADVSVPLEVTLLWRSSATGQTIHSHRVADGSGGTRWLKVRKLQGWAEDISSLGLALQGTAGEAATLSEVSVLPASLSSQLQATYADWIEFSPWLHSSVNTHSGVRSPTSSVYPLPVAAIFFALSLSAYILLLLLSGKSPGFDWRVVAGIFLVCWIGLDLLWQGKLLQQLGQTYATFAGKDTQAKQLAGPDAELVDLMTQVRQRITPAESRVFVSSKDDYRGMRSAYYLYPLNVFWGRRWPELPPQEYLRSGDYIVLVKPADTRFDPSTDKLQPNPEETIAVEHVMSRPQGSLYRVK